jgi:7,8-dihydro-6-hydroxymethylpterin-pyrophosphokinase
LESRPQTALISVTAYSSDGPQLLKKVFEDLRQGMEIGAVSSIYKVKGQTLHSPQIHDIRSVNSFEGLCVVVELQTLLTPLAVLEFLKQVEGRRKSELLHRNVSLNLLFFEDLTYMSPDLTLPHPDVHLRPELVIPAAEIWGERRHPVLGSSLSQLTREFQSRDWGEFFAQGHSLLDF